MNSDYTRTGTRIVITREFRRRNSEKERTGEETVKKERTGEGTVKKRTGEGTVKKENRRRNSKKRENCARIAITTVLGTTCINI